MYSCLCWLDINCWIVWFFWWNMGGWCWFSIIADVTSCFWLNNKLNSSLLLLILSNFQNQITIPHPSSLDYWKSPNVFHITNFTSGKEIFKIWLQTDMDMTVDIMLACRGRYDKKQDDVKIFCCFANLNSSFFQYFQYSIFLSYDSHNVYL